MDNANRTEPAIYFDPEDEATDGLGWNVVDGGAIAARFATEKEALIHLSTMQLAALVAKWKAEDCSPRSSGVGSSLYGDGSLYGSSDAGLRNGDDD